MKTKYLITILSLTAGSLHAEKEYPFVSAEHISVPEGFEVQVWAKSPMFFNPTNMDIDYQGRIWVAEGRAYRAFRNKSNSQYLKKGDRIMVLSDTDASGQADESHVFVQDPDLVAPLGIAVIDNKVVVSQPPSIIVYHDVNRDAVFDPQVDKKEILLTGFGGKDHDHSLHAVTTGPSGQWYFNTGNAGTHIVEDKDGWTLRVGSAYKGGSPSVTGNGPLQGGKPGLKSDDGHVYVGSAILRVNPDGTGLRVVGHNMRNSYEETINSFGDVFQNDNDDPPACRTTWVMEYGNMGFASDNGSRKWQLDRRPGQKAAVAHWRQEDPGKLPAGDVYGSGSPTGIAFYENGALGEKWNGLLLSCEAARNVVFGYLPKPQGAGYALERFDFIKVAANKNASKEDQDLVNYFRPSDVTVGPDGCIYVADWYDRGVGGHRTSDETLAGAIYRIAPVGNTPQVPAIDLDTIEGQILALKSPANNVRNIGFTRLQTGGEASLAAVKAMLDDQSKYIQARAIWLLAQLGDAGITEVEKYMENSTDAQIKITCFRALRFVDHNVLDMCKSLASDPSPAVRREVALAMRDRSWEEAGEILIELFDGFDGEDRWYLEALGTGATRKEAQFYDSLVKKESTQDPIQWSGALAKMAWRLHPVDAVEALQTRAMDLNISLAERKEALTALGHIEEKVAVSAVVSIAESGPADTQALAKWWLINMSKGYWRPFVSAMKGLNIDKDAPKADKDYIIPFKNPDIVQYTVEDVLALEGSAEKGKASIASCYMCHQVNGAGIEFGPALDGWGAGRSKEEIAEAIVNPNAAIAHGYEGSVIQTKSGHTIHGINMDAGSHKETILKVMGGRELPIKKGSIANPNEKKNLEHSLMLSSKQLGLSAQSVADIVEFLKSSKN